MVKHLSKNVAPVAGGVYTIHLLSLEALLIVVDSIEAHCRNNQVVSLCISILETESFIVSTVSYRQARKACRSIIAPLLYHQLPGGVD